MHKKQKKLNMIHFICYFGIVSDLLVNGLTHSQLIYILMRMITHR